jgi:hypothetical protein
MTRHVQLRELCHSRAGDKGDTLMLSLIPYDPHHYEWIREHVTATRVKTYFGTMCAGSVERYELPAIHAFNFVLNNALDGGCNKSLRNDIFGKALSGPFLDMIVDVPDGFRMPVMGAFGLEPGAD